MTIFYHLLRYIECLFLLLSCAGDIVSLHGAWFTRIEVWTFNYTWTDFDYIFNLFLSWEPYSLESQVYEIHLTPICSSTLKSKSFGYTLF
jgi:hypothetical protein